MVLKASMDITLEEKERGWKVVRDHEGRGYVIAIGNESVEIKAKPETKKKEKPKVEVKE